MVTVVERARVPLVRMVDTSSDLRVDLCIDDGPTNDRGRRGGGLRSPANGTASSEFINRYGATVPAATASAGPPRIP